MLEKIIEYKISLKLFSFNVILKSGSIKKNIVRKKNAISCLVRTEIHFTLLEKYFNKIINELYPKKLITRNNNKARLILSIR